MRRIIKYALLGMSLVSASSFANEDNNGGSYINVSVGGGVSTLRYSSDNVSSNMRFGGTANVDFNYFFNKNVGLSLGVGATLANSSFSLSETIKTAASYFSYTTGSENEYVYNSKFDGWEEKQNIWSIDVPVGIVVKFDLGKSIMMSLGGGVKLQFPIKAKYDVKAGTRTTTGYYPQTNTEVYDIPHQGFYTLDGSRQRDDINTKTLGVGLYADLDMMHDFGDVLFYYGLYGSFGLTTITTNDDGVWNNPNGMYISPLNSSDIDKTKLLGFGLKLGVKIPLKKADK